MKNKELLLYDFSDIDFQNKDDIKKKLLWSGFV